MADGRGFDSALPAGDVTPAFYEATFVKPRFVWI